MPFKNENKITTQIRATNQTAPGFPASIKQGPGDGGAPAFSLHAEQVEMVLSLLRKDFSATWSVAALAKKARLTERQLQAAFKSVYGKTVMSYARELRLHYAHGVLEKHGYPLRVVCEMVGYPDVSNFSVAFLKEFGYRPGSVLKKK